VVEYMTTGTANGRPYEPAKGGRTMPPHPLPSGAEGMAGLEQCP